LSREGDSVMLTIHEPEAQIHRWRFDATRRFALISYSSEGVSGRQQFILCSDFKEFGSDLLPRVVEYGKDSARSVRLSNIEYRLDDPANAPETYHLRWPAGTQTLDERPKTQPAVKVDAQPKGEQVNGDDK
jgi:hypothetical protein